MRLRVELSPVADGLAGVAAMRKAHLAGLPQVLAPIVDVQVQQGTVLAIEGRGRANGARCGYLVTDVASRTLLELFLWPEYWAAADVVVGHAVTALGLERAIVQQFDALLLSACLPHQEAVASLGLICRDYVPRPLPRIPGIEFSERLATIDDLPAITTVDQDVFTRPARLLAVIEAGFVRVYEHDARLIGFGVLRPVGPDRRHVELGIAVDRSFRARGYAVYMLRAMIDHCLQLGLQPVGGCAEDNVASRQMGERVGLVSRHRLLELRF